MVRKCEGTGCDQFATCKEKGKNKRLQYCKKHSKQGMVNITKKICETDECSVIASFNMRGIKPGKYCGTHKIDGMINVSDKHCAFEGGCDTQPMFNAPGLKIGKFCDDHKEPGMINVKSKICTFAGCPTQASFGKEGEKTPIRCALHKDDNMSDVRNVKCMSKDCPIKPSYGSSVDRIPKYCSLHKDDNMIDVVHKMCEYQGCISQASYGNTIIRKKIFCSLHKQNNMILLTGIICHFEGCNTYPTYNYTGEKTPVSCMDHKYDGMVNVKSKTCEECKKRPTFNYNGFKTPRFCSSHKHEGMVNVTDKKCEFVGCGTRPIYNVKGIKGGRFCDDHKEPGMINVKDKKCEKCDTIPIYGNKGTKKALRCTEHKTEIMVDLRHGACEEGICTTRPTFNIPSEKTGKYCVLHKKDGMVDVSNNLCKLPEGCITRATCGYLFQTPIRCTKHKLANMKTGPEIFPKCSINKCPNKPYYCESGKMNPIRCEDHKTPADINIVEKECKLCGVHDFIPANIELCGRCGYMSKERIMHAKELRIKNVLDSNKISYLSHDKVPIGSCNKYRPDFIIDYGGQTLIIEVDEDQHERYPCECEITRMINICEDFGGLPVAFIRYNPDGYKDNDGKIKKGKTENPMREKKLIELLRNVDNMIKTDRYPKYHLSVYYMYYDGYNGIPNRQHIDYANHSIKDIVDSVF